MPTDPGLSADSCLFLNQGPSPHWWLSPDIIVNGFDGVPVPVGNRTVNVKANCRSGASCSAVAGTAIRVELWIGDPNLVIDKTNPASCDRIGITPVFAPAAGASTSVPFAWTVTGGTGPHAPGHKCLLALVYPQGLTPDEVRFYPPDDTHYAQKNLCIVTCSSPCGQDIQTANPNAERMEAAVIRAIADPMPSVALQKLLKPALKAFKKFRRFSPQPPPPFTLKFDRVRDLEIASFQKPGREGSFGKQKAPNVEARINLKPKQRIKFRLSTDLRNVPPGDGFVVHVTHSVRNVVRGGVTVVFVKV